MKQIGLDATLGRLAISIALIAGACAGSAHAQSIEPRAYSPAPLGMNFLIVGIADSEGSLPTDPAIPLTDSSLSLRTLLFAYARTLDLFGSSGKFDVIVPYGKLSGSALYQGQPVERHVTGFADPLVRLSMIFAGAPAMQPAAFRTYRQSLVAGASVQVSLPVGQYEEGKLLNIGTNRWSVKPEIGVSKMFGRWTLETAGSITFYGANDKFFGNSRKTQAPIYSARWHVIYSLPSGPWLALDANYFAGGESRVNGGNERNLQKNWRAGITAAAPISRSFSLKFNASRGVSARTGNNYDLYGVALQYRWADR